LEEREMKRERQADREGEREGERGKEGERGGSLSLARERARVRERTSSTDIAKQHFLNVLGRHLCRFNRSGLQWGVGFSSGFSVSI